ncbi:MAG: tetratricopeptide repeat protein [Alphaproteobacteria bacterium]|nr:tetratricopeptide repeat protein [Alphaproteobacteria bacterium]
MMGLLLKEQNKISEALRYFNDAVASAPQNADAWLELTRIHHDAASWRDCQEAARKTLALVPAATEANLMLGSACMALREFTDAASAAAKVVVAAPDNAEVHFFYVRCLMALKQFKEALPYARTAAQLAPDAAEAHYLLGACLKRSGEEDAAEAPLKRALQLNAKKFEALNDLADIYIARGDAARAIDSLRQSNAIKPYNIDAISGLCFYGAFDHRISATALFKINRDWSKQLNRDSRGHKYPPRPTHQDDKIHIGYIANDLFDHVTSWFMEPVLANHDRSKFHITCYSGASQKDNVTARLTSLVDRWRNINEEDIAETSDTIRRDGVDILVLASFFRGKDRRIMAYQSAPVQVGYHNRVASTGLDTVDYIISEEGSDPVGKVENLYTESLVRLTNHNIYLPPTSAVTPAPPPCLKNGFITFGSFNNHAKINETVIRVWAAILKATPNSRLILRSSRYFENPITRAFFKERFAVEGVGVDQLEFQGFRTTRQEHLHDMNDADIALDPFPCNGGTTTCESLWMGLPLITMETDSYMGRQGASYLSKLGLQDLICHTPEAYLEVACRLASNIERIQQLRNTLRPAVESGVFSERQHVQELELAYETMWRRHRNNIAHTPFSVHDNHIKTP